MRSMIKEIIIVLVSGTLLILVGLFFADRFGAFDKVEPTPVESGQTIPKAAPSRLK